MLTAIHRIVSAAGFPLRTSVLFYFFFTAMLRCLQAQVNTESMRSTEKRTGLFGSAGANVSFKSGNVDFLSFGASLRVDLKDSLHSAFVVGTIDLQSQSGTTFERSGFYHARYTWRLHSYLGMEVFGQQEYNQSRRLHNRLLGGVGLRLPILQSEKMLLVVGSAWMFEYEELANAADREQESRTRHHRWSNYLVTNIFVDERLSFSNILYAQPCVDAFSDIRVLDEATLSISMTKNLVLQNSMNLRYDSQPPDGVERTDLSLTSGILITF